MRLYFEGQGKRSTPIRITKDGRKWLYFIAESNLCRYRMDKVTGEVHVAPYWIPTKMYVK